MPLATACTKKDGKAAAAALIDLAEEQDVGEYASEPNNRALCVSGVGGWLLVPMDSS